MKKLIFILLAVGLPLGVATLANPAGLTAGQRTAAHRLTKLIPVGRSH